MSDQEVIFTNNHFGNSFSRVAIIVGVVWLGSVIIKQTMSPSTSKQYHQDKRYTMKSQNKVNKQIEAKNRSVKLPPKVDIFSRNKRFNRYF